VDENLNDSAELVVALRAAGAMAGEQVVDAGDEREGQCLAVGVGTDPPVPLLGIQVGDDALLYGKFRRVPCGRAGQSRVVIVTGRRG
jgi:hypothetical protein